MTIDDQCVSIQTGTLRPDQRVNYTRGMVLGLAEFLQEQQYGREHDYLDHRGLVGYGTVSGLHVGAERLAADRDWMVRVEPGVAVDQLGRTVAVRSAQCARLGAWLAAQDQATPGAVASHIGLSGELAVYVVAAYAECLDDLVPLPGQPCSSSGQSSAASRIRDAWAIALRLDPPPMPAWDTDRRLARLLRAVHVVPGLDPADSSEQLILDAVLALPDELPAGPSDLWPPIVVPTPSTPSGVAGLVLPAETAADAFDRILTAWVTRVRPRIAPDVIRPADDQDPAVLLATITVVPGPITPSGSSIELPDDLLVDDEGRPYVLHGRLLTELVTPDAQPLDIVPPPVSEAPDHHLATLTAELDLSAELIGTLWFHLDGPVALTEPVLLRAPGGWSATLEARPVGDPQFSDVWELTGPTGPSAAPFPRDGTVQVAAVLRPDTVLVGDATTTLAARLAGGLAVLDVQADGTVEVFGTVAVDTPPVVPPPQPVMPVREFVTVTQLKPQLLELWFHVQPGWPKPAVLVTQLDPDLIKVIVEDDGREYKPDAVNELLPNVWQAEFREVEFPPGQHLRLEFFAPKIPVQTDFGVISLVDWMARAGVTFLNWDENQGILTAFLRTGAL